MPNASEATRLVGAILRVDGQCTWTLARIKSEADLRKAGDRFLLAPKRTRRKSGPLPQPTVKYGRIRTLRPKLQQLL